MEITLLKRLLTLQLIARGYESVGGDISELIDVDVAYVLTPLFESAPKRKDEDKRATLEDMFRETLAEINAQFPVETTL